jgi:hypothetical protein
VSDASHGITIDSSLGFSARHVAATTGRAALRDSYAVCLTAYNARRLGEGRAALSYDPQRAIERLRRLDEIEEELKTIEKKLHCWRAVLARRYLSSPRSNAVIRKRGADVRPDLNWNRPAVAAMMSYRNTIESD